MHRVRKPSSLAGTARWIFRNVDSRSLTHAGTTTTVSAHSGPHLLRWVVGLHFGRGYAR